MNILSEARVLEIVDKAINKNKTITTLKQNQEKQSLAIHKQGIMMEEMQSNVRLLVEGLFPLM